MNIPWRDWIIPARIGSRTCIIGIIAFLALNAGSHAQSSSAKPTLISAKVRDAATSAAYAAAKNGNFATALAELDRLVPTRRSAEQRELAILRHFASISAQLLNERSSEQATGVAKYTIARLEPLSSRLRGREQGEALTAAGRLFEFVVGDVKSARAFYARAVLVDPEATAARDRLNRLIAIEEHARARDEANQLLRNRASKR